MARSELQRSLETGDPLSPPLRSFAASRCVATPMPRLVSLLGASLTPLEGEGPQRDTTTDAAWHNQCVAPTQLSGDNLSSQSWRGPQSPWGSQGCPYRLAVAVGHVIPIKFFEVTTGERVSCRQRCPKTRQPSRRREVSSWHAGLRRGSLWGPVARSPRGRGTARAGARRTPGPRDAAGFLSRELAGASSPSRRPRHREPLEARGGSAARNNSGTGTSCEHQRRGQ